RAAEFARADEDVKTTSPRATARGLVVSWGTHIPHQSADSPSQENEVGKARQRLVRWMALAYHRGPDLSLDFRLLHLALSSSVRHPVPTRTRAAGSGTGGGTATSAASECEKIKSPDTVPRAPNGSRGKPVKEMSSALTSIDRVVTPLPPTICSFPKTE